MKTLENNLAFVILCPELNISGLRSTVSSIRASFANSPCLCVVAENANEQDVTEIGHICPVQKGKNTFTSLINCGIRKSTKEWNFIIVAGNILRASMLNKYTYFLKEDKEVLYAVVDRNAWRFEDATINGMLIGKKTLKEVGDFPDDESLIFSKLAWSATANEKGYKLKGLVGVKI